MSASDRREVGPNIVLALLLIAYILNFLDRQILGILAQPIKADLGLTDTQFGAIGGLAFALLYSVLGVPLGILADRTSRGGVIAFSLALWSTFTALCGTASNFGQMFAYRLGVGIGEAGGVAPSYALIADRFPPERRARAIAIFSLGVPLGLSLGILVGAYIAKALDWRAAFLSMGAVGLLFSPILWRLTSRSKHAAQPNGPALGETFSQIAGKPSFWLLALASSMSSLCGYGLALWTPSILMRSFGFTLTGTANFIASLLLIGGTAGMLGGGILADRMKQQDKRWSAWLPAIAWTLTVPAFAFGLLSNNLALVWIFLLIGNGLNILWFGPLVGAIQQLAPAGGRASASGAYLLVNNLIGLGVGPLLMGWLSDALKPSFGADSLRYAAISCLAFYAVAALLALLASNFLTNDWVED